MVISHEHPAYIRKWQTAGKNRYNGAYYYSKEIVENIIPRLKTDRNFITVNVEGVGCDHAVVFIHNNLHPGRYEWLSRYKDLILVCGIPETVEKVAHLGKAIYLPLSVDVEYVKKFAVKEKTRDAAFVGRPAKRKGLALPKDIDILEDMPRDQLLTEMAKYKEVYAVGRCAIEAKILKLQTEGIRPEVPEGQQVEAARQCESRRDAAGGAG